MPCCCAPSLDSSLSDSLSTACARVRVLDAQALGEPGLLGYAKLSLSELGLEPNLPPQDIWLPLKVWRLSWRMHLHLQILMRFAGMEVSCCQSYGEIDVSEQQLSGAATDGMQRPT